MDLAGNVFSVCKKKHLNLKGSKTNKKQFIDRYLSNIINNNNFHLNNMNDKAVSTDLDNSRYEQHNSSTLLPPRRWAFTSNLVLAGCKNRPPPSPSSASAQNVPKMIFHRFDMQNCAQKQ